MTLPSEVWRFNPNRRHYKRDANGHSVGGPIYAHHWYSDAVVGETRLSWLLESGDKVPKKYAVTDRAVVDADIWVNAHRHRVSQGVAHCSDITTLKAIADLIGYVASAEL